LRDLHGNAYVDGHKLELRASMGAALYPDDGDDLDLLLKAADRKMYQAKQRGRVYPMQRHKH
jgi:diguanylate cyclase (GGDEF)-like protein